MAFVRTFNSLISCLIKWKPTNLTFDTKHYSVFPKNYINPVYRKEEQAKLYQSEEGQKVSHIPIKPALNYQTSSEFYDDSVRLFTNYLMRNGNKVLARKLIEKTFQIIKMMQLEKYNKTAPGEREHIQLDPKVIFHDAIKNCTPILELQTIRKGGIPYKVPIPLTERRAKFLSMNWLLRTAKQKESTQRFTVILAKEMVDASNNIGRVIKKKQDLHKLCEANRAYAHFRWK